MATEVSTDRFRSQRLRRTFMALLGILLFELVCWYALRIELYDSLGFGWYLWSAILLGSMASLAIVGSTLALIVRRGWFSLREFMIAMLVLGALCGVAGNRYNEKRQQREAAQYLVERGARIVLEGDGQQKDEPGLERLLGRDWFHGVVAVDARELTAEDMGVLVALTELKTLTLHGITDDHLAPLANVPSLKTLVLHEPPAISPGMPLSLVPEPHHFSGAGLKHLKNHASLEHLLLNDQRVSEEELAALRDLPHLQTLQITFPVTEIGLEHLGQCRRLRWLTLNESGSGFEHLANLYQLEALVLGGTGQVIGGVAGLERCPQLRSLTVFNAQLSVDDFGHLAQSRVLTSLSIHQANFSDAAMEQLSQSNSLASLDLGGEVSNEALAHLAAMPKLFSVTILSTSRRPISDLGLKHLSKIKNLTTLRLGLTTITDEGLNCVESISNLKTLSFFSEEVSPQRRVALKTKLPYLELQVNGDRSP